MTTKTTHTITVEIDVQAPTKYKAKSLVQDYLKMAEKEFAIENRIITWEITTEPNCSGCGNHHQE